jgi:hypothetical protein
MGRFVLMRGRRDLAKGEPHEIIVPPGPGGRPGERVLAPSRSFYAPRLARDLSREDFRVLLDRNGTSLAAVCLGPMEERGTPEEGAREALNHFVGPAVSMDDRLTPDIVGGQAAVHYHFTFPSGRRLSEWHFGYQGWRFVAGVLKPEGNPKDAVAAARQVLSTWKWVERGAQAGK